MRNAESVKARLKNIAKETRRTMQDVLIAYGLERTIMRLAKSSHIENFTLKGGIFLYALMDGQFARATTDIDLLAQGISNDIDNMAEVFRDIFLVQLDDPLRYDIDSLRLKSITEFKDYHGVNVMIDAYLDRTKIQVSVDVGFCDIVAFEDDYASDSVRQSRWKSFAKKKKVKLDVTFKDTIDQIKIFINPMIEAINCDTEFKKIWRHDLKSWVGE